jgi:UDP-glucose 4-epimerase
MGDVEALQRLSGSRVLVTGASGFLASRLIPRLIALDCSLRLVTRPSKPPPSVAERGTCVHLPGIISDRSFWATALDAIDFVFHFAAQTSIHVASHSPTEDWDANVLPMLHLLETCREHDWRPGILFSGTVTQTGLPARLPVDETHPDRPVSIYDWHKLLAESSLEHFVRKGWARGTTLRLANIYGPGAASGAPDRGTLNQIMRRALRGEPITLYGTGREIRDYLFVDDAVQAFLVAASQMERVDGRHFVLGSGVGHTVDEAFRLVAGCAERLTGREVRMLSVDPPQRSSIDRRNFVADVTQFRCATDWRPETTLINGIEVTLKTFLAAS